MEVCLLSHGNWDETERAVRSALGFGLTVHVGVTVDDRPPFSDRNLHIYRVPWNAHFADARNNLLGQLRPSGRYVLWLDSDETLLSYPKSGRQPLEDPIYGVRIVLQEGQTTSVRSACHRRSEEVSFSGGIHERPRLATPWTGGRVSMLEGVVILHTGYEDPEQTQAKRVRNLRIAETSADADREGWGVLVSKARYLAATGQATAMDWIRVYRAAEREAASFPSAGDLRWEAAASLAHRGFLKPAESLAAAEPLNIPLQMSLLVGSCALSGICCPERLAFVDECLVNCVWDDRYGFPLAWLQFRGNDLETYVREQARGLAWASEAERENGSDKAMDRQAVFVQEDDILTETFEDELVLLSRRTNRVLTLNETAQVFWEALAFGVSRAECCRLMQDAGADKDERRIEAEIDGLFDAFLEHGFIRQK